MTGIWKVLVSEPRKAVDTHFQTILSELLREMGAKLWRSREAASLALADLLQGRRWADVKDRLEEMWRMAFRAIDDIKVGGPCADRAVILGRTVMWFMTSRSWQMVRRS